MEDSADHSSQLEQELEALSAIYINELTFNRDETGQVKEISLVLHPATANDTTKQFVCMNLVFHPTNQYPDEAPAISIRNPRGLGEEEIASLAEDMKARAESSIGEVMLYTLIEIAKDSLTEGNIPHCPCIVCLEHFDASSHFHRTACYHYFHNHCLHKYLKHVREQMAEEEAEDARGRIPHLQASRGDKSIICPMCRCPLDAETLTVQSIEPIDEEEDDYDFVPSAALREQQRNMAEQFEKQRAQGGIIDLEWEKNKYLLSPEDNASQRVSQTSVRPNEGKEDTPDSTQRNLSDETEGPVLQSTQKVENQKKDRRETYHRKDDRNQKRNADDFRERNKFSSHGHGNYSYSEWRGSNYGKGGQRWEDHHSFQREYRDDRRRGRGRGPRRSQGQELNWVDHGKDERDGDGSKRDQDFRSKNRKWGDGRGSYNPRRPHSSRMDNQDRGGYRGNKCDGSPNARPLSSRREGGVRAEEVQGIDTEPVDQDKNVELRNFHIHDKWEAINSVHQDIDDKVKRMPTKFGGVHGDNFKYNLEKEDEAFSDSQDVYPSDTSFCRKVRYRHMNGQPESFYPDFHRGTHEEEEYRDTGQPYLHVNSSYSSFHYEANEEESWEDEIDPYASEITKFKDEGLKKYFEYQKIQRKYYEDKLAKKVEKENAICTEMRRIHKEKSRKPSHLNSLISDGNDSHEENSNLSHYHEEAGKSMTSHHGNNSGTHWDRQKGRAREATSKSETEGRSLESFHLDKKSMSVHDGQSDKLSEAECAGGKETGNINVPVSDITWFGSKPVQDFYHPRSTEDQDISRDLINSSAYEDAWERRSQLEKKAERKSSWTTRRNKDDEVSGRKYSTEKNNKKSSRERIGRRGTNPTQSWQEGREGGAEFHHVKADRKGDPLHGNESSRKANTGTFQKPKPLDMRKANNTAALTVNTLDGTNSNQECYDRNGKAPPKFHFKRPKPLDFRKSGSRSKNPSSKLPHQPDKDLPS